MRSIGKRKSEIASVDFSLNMAILIQQTIKCNFLCLRGQAVHFLKQFKRFTDLSSGCGSGRRGPEVLQRRRMESRITPSLPATKIPWSKRFLPVSMRWAVNLAGLGPLQTDDEDFFIQQKRSRSAILYSDSREITCQLHVWETAFDIRAAALSS